MGLEQMVLIIILVILHCSGVHFEISNVHLEAFDSIYNSFNNYMD